MLEIPVALHIGITQISKVLAKDFAVAAYVVTSHSYHNLARTTLSKQVLKISHRIVVISHNIFAIAYI